jgi:hypothetical protein
VITRSKIEISVENTWIEITIFSNGTQFSRRSILQGDGYDYGGDWRGNG